MNMDEKTPASCQSEHDWINRRLDRIETKIRLLTRLLIEKKIIGSDIAKSIEETSAEDLIDWYMKEIEKKE